MEDKFSAKVTNYLTQFANKNKYFKPTWYKYEHLKGSIKYCSQFATTWTNNTVNLFE